MPDLSISNANMYLVLSSLDLDKMQFAILATIALLVSATAFVPVARVARTSSLQMADFSKEIGAQVPLGFFDPLGLLKDADQETFDLYRSIETKHGRVSMLAILGELSFNFKRFQEMYYCSILLVSCFVWSGAIDSSDILL